MLAHQQAIEITEHNVANANTPGYRRQEAILAAGHPYGLSGLDHSIGAGQMGTGVTVEKIKRFSVDFFDGRYRRELAESKRWEAAYTVLQQIEGTLNETGSDGLIAKLDDFWTGWQALSADPNNTSLRADLYDRSVALTEAFHWRAQALDYIRRDQDLTITQRVQEINSSAEQIAHLNQEIARVKSVGDQPNDLLDERDRLLDRLSEIAGATSYLQPNEEVIVSIGGHTLVMGKDNFDLVAAPDITIGNLVKVTWADGQSFSADTGELKGLFDARDIHIKSQIDGLNSLAGGLITRINTIHQSGVDLNDVTGRVFFTGTDARTMRVDSALSNLSNIAAAGAINSPGDGSVALQLAQVQRELLMNGGTTTLNDYHNSQVTGLGLVTLKAHTSAQDRGLVAKALSDQRESVTGVSMDEEAANLIKYQRAYQAAARMMTALDEMLDKVINGMGVVGR